MTNGNGAQAPQQPQGLQLQIQVDSPAPGAVTLTVALGGVVQALTIQADLAEKVGEKMIEIAKEASAAVPRILVPKSKILG